MSINKLKECQELKNIKYKTLLQTGKNKLDEKTEDSKSDINEILENECIKSKKENWSKLDKSVKMIKINEYIKKLTELHNLDSNEQEKLTDYISNHLDKKNLMKNKDVNYFKEDGVIESIPNLIFNKNNRKFTLKKSTTHISTSKNLGPTKKNNSKSKTKNKIKSIKIVKS